MRIRLAYRGVHGTKQGRKEGKRALSRSPSPSDSCVPSLCTSPQGPLCGATPGAAQAGPQLSISPDQPASRNGTCQTAWYHNRINKQGLVEVIYCS